MKQQTFAAGDFERNRKPTRREQLLTEMDKVVPWSLLCEQIDPFYPMAGNGRPPVGLERMLRRYFLQHWFNLSDPGAEEALYEFRSMCRFAGIDIGREPVPDESTILGFHHLLERNALGEPLFQVLEDLLHGDETRVWVDLAHTEETEVLRRTAPCAQDSTHEKTRCNQLLDAVAKSRNSTKSRVRAKVESVFGILERVSGFTRVRYSGLTKNAHALFVLCTLTNLYLTRRRLRCLA